jgi:hypothetical protein
VCRGRSRTTIVRVTDRVIHREEVTAALLALHDIREDVATILEFLAPEEDDGEQEDDA